FLSVASPGAITAARPATRALGATMRGMDPHSAWVFYRVCWWLHALLVLAFLNYLPYSKHLHVVTSLFNVFFSNTSWKSERAVIRPMDLEADVAQFGASDVEHLTWKNLLDGYSCTECGRCTAVCPA